MAVLGTPEVMVGQDAWGAMVGLGTPAAMVGQEAWGAMAGLGTLAAMRELTFQEAMTNEP